MIKEETYIRRRDKEENLYKQLQEESLKMVQQLSGNRWTDFNEHDPGVTILDILHYALQEFDYLFETSFEKILADPEKKEWIYQKHGLLSPDEIFEKTIVTPGDYEELFRSIPGVKDCRVEVDQVRYNFLIEKEEQADENKIKKELLACYHAHRNLCENAGDIVFGKITNKKDPDPSGTSVPQYTPIPSKKSVTPSHFIYHTIQNEFPECYGIGERGLPADVSQVRKSEALQFKGYLLVFDYLLSGILQQFKNIPSLLELSGKLPEPFRPDVEATGSSKLLDKGKLRQSAIFDPEEMIRQKNSFFDHLDRLYGENTRIAPADHSLAFRARLIRLYPLFNTLRFRSFNLLDKELKSMPGLKQMVQTMFGKEEEQEMSVINMFSRYNLTLITDQRFFVELQERYRVRFLLGDYNRIPERYEISPVPQISVRYTLKKFYKLRDQLNLFWDRILFEGFLKHGMDPGNYRSLRLPDKSGYLLLYQHPGQEEWINMGFFFEKERLIETCNLLWLFIEKLNRESFTCYFMEHILLQEKEKDFSSTESDKLTIVLTGWVDHFYARKTYLDLFEERLPVHLDIRYIWLGVEEMQQFEKYYFKWRGAWAYEDKEEITRCSRKLKEIIEK